MKKLSIDEVVRRLDIIHHGLVSIDESTYVNTRCISNFYDKDFGMWPANVNSVLRGSGHPKRALSKARQTCLDHHGTEYPMQSKIIQQKSKISCLNKYKVSNVSQLESIKQIKRETTLKNYGVEYPNQNSEILSKVKKLSKFSQVINHWKTGKELTCTAKYEIAFVNWCNKNQIDFDWQISIKTSLLTPKGHQAIYHIDAFIKSGEFKNTWIEIKGFMREIGRQKWEWFHTMHPNDSQLWNRPRLKELGII